MSGEKFKVVVKFSPGVPDNIDEILLVECGHFPAKRFRVYGVGIYPACLLSFPRAEDEQFSHQLVKAKELLDQGMVSYSSKFEGDEAVKLMPPVHAKLVDRERALIKDPRGMEAEAEADRSILCEKIITRLE